MYEYQSHLFWARSSANYANYARQPVRQDNEEMFTITARAKQNNMDVVIKSVGSAAEAIDVFNQLKSLPSIHEFLLKKRISSNNEITTGMAKKQHEAYRNGTEYGEIFRAWTTMEYFWW